MSDELETLRAERDKLAAIPLDQPDRDGWWEWTENGERRPELVLVRGGGALVASDDEWEQATGSSPEHESYSENYWEGTETTPQMMPGRWRYLGPTTPAQITNRAALAAARAESGVRDGR